MKTPERGSSRFKGWGTGWGSDVLQLRWSRRHGQTCERAQPAQSHVACRSFSEDREPCSPFAPSGLAGNEGGAHTFSADRQTGPGGVKLIKAFTLEFSELQGEKKPRPPSEQVNALRCRDPFGGENSHLCAVSTVSPGMASCENTLNTLR